MAVRHERSDSPVRADERPRPTSHRTAMSENCSDSQSEDSSDRQGCSEIFILISPPPTQ
ncbi:uncharacterized protein PGTG_21672 [Puccinia graminis f. sp. tritici CRL 75-36-700-3]|uniref:Uncharacterized protein n=1 Tax=Puccinia graminis f. sp. tritici (strain CRL 75-36-700-3 / race SCCL) TaxID=418459 RepID=H6QS55_PUCGT|nr:uncharacterized protein PGTG_21672 [Puccinia graminis f. sp. tritici CRL 75-36-700-3]EHS63495.1 hypothetical protein PGTG_21672 [Puccinia graminis f. sp. tritici CRL 75-36-700-3]